LLCATAANVYLRESEATAANVYLRESEATAANGLSARKCNDSNNKAPSRNGNQPHVLMMIPIIG